MKKFLVSFIVVGLIFGGLASISSFSSFTPKAEAATSLCYRWYNYNGRWYRVWDYRWYNYNGRRYRVCLLDRVPPSTTVPPTTTIVPPTTTVPPVTTVPPSTTVPPTTTIPPTTTTVPVGDTYPGTRQASLWPFSASSPWNLPLGVGATYSGAGSAATIDLTDTSIPIYLNSLTWSIPVAISKSTDPEILVVASSYIKPDTSAGQFRVKFPAGTQAGAGGDRHLAIVAPDGIRLDEFWAFYVTTNQLGTTYRAGKHGRFDLTGTGFGEIEGQNWGTRAYGGSSIGGLIRTWEWNAGEIRHALAIALVANQLTPGHVWPATSHDTGSSGNSGSIPEGALVAIPSSVNIDSLALTPKARMIAKALQDYGAYVVDRSGNVSLYAESNTNVSSVTQSDLQKIRAALRLVTNSGVASPGGPGARRTPLAPAFS